jgi:phosphoserine phosphatase RsbU/P
MDQILNLLISLIIVIAIITVVTYAITHTKWFVDALSGKLYWKNQTFLLVAFGLLSIVGTYACIDVMGVKVNFRDLGPMIAGLIGGPVAGIGAGLIGGLHRLFFVGGATTIACSLATIFAGIFGSIIWYLAGKRFIGITVAVVFAALQEVFHMGLVLLIVQPYSYAVSVVEQAVLPMVVFNCVGMFIFASIINRSSKERSDEKKGNERLSPI